MKEAFLAKPNYYFMFFPLLMKVDWQTARNLANYPHAD